MHRNLLPAALCAALLTGLAAAPLLSHGHGDVTPQVVDTSEIAPLGDAWRDANPYRGDEKAVAIGKSGYNQNCAR